MLKYTDLKEKPKEFLAATGLTDEEFQVLLPTFEKCYQFSSNPKPKATKKKKQRARGGGRKAKLLEISDKLLFVLIYQKTAQLQTMHGLQFGLRLTKENLSDVVMEIACGLHNLRVTFRQPMQTIDITNVEELSYFR